MPDIPDPLLAQLKALSAVLDKRQREQKRLRPYDEPNEENTDWIPAAVTEARLTNAYRYLMPMIGDPWGSLIVDSSHDVLELTGIQSPDKEVDAAVWGVWQDNSFDAEWRLAQRAALVDGRSFALIEPSLEDGMPEIFLDDCSQMVVQYREGSRRFREAALRRWVDLDGVPHATLFRPDGIYKFKGQRDTGMETQSWETRIDPREDDWQLAPVTRGVVPVVEIAVNRRLRPGSYGFARGEYAHATGLIDRINLLTFLGLVVAIWMGFPLRGVIGEKILRDDEGKLLPPFDADADSIFQLENPQARIEEFKAADRKNLSVFSELDQLAVITKTPRHEFPLEQGMSNISADALRASAGARNAKVKGSHKVTLGEAAEEIQRVSGLILPEPVELSRRAEARWADHENRSLAERADAASKLKDVLPWTAVADLALNATAEQIARWQSERASDPLSILVSAATQPAAPAAPPV